jgi:hypothetical protein
MRARFLTRRLLAVLAGAAAIGALVCCGGGGSASSQDFTAEANRICHDAQQQFDQIQRRPPKTADQAEKQADALADVSRQALDNLRTLESPDEVKATYERYLNAREKAIGYLEAGRDAAARNDPNAYAQAKRKAAADQATRLQLARQAGLRSCSRPSVTLGK